MIAIKGMEMPESCIDCPFVKAEGTKFFCSRIMKYIDKDNLGNKHDDCPLVEIVTCKDCKHWDKCSVPRVLDEDDEDEKEYRYCHLEDFNTAEDYFCAYGERKE